MPEVYNGESDGDDSGARSVWSGTIAFGLVSLPVTIFTANRPRPFSLRMLAEDGTPLQRRFFCSLETCSHQNKPLDRDELVRGFEADKGHYIEVTEDELDALAPKKSREIDLRRFVPLKDIDPMHFKRAYFLLPDEGASKAYRLLARSMEESGRAGIATFVMRGKEYLLAIIAQKGVLRGESLRFHDEIRRPSDLALPRVAQADPSKVQPMLDAISELSADRLDREQLSDQWSRQLDELIQLKLESDEDVLHAADLDAHLDEEEEAGEVIDLMEVLKQRLAAAAPEQDRRRKQIAVEEEKREQSHDLDLEADKASKAELYELAKELNIHGRSQMSKQDLLKAIQRAR